VASDPNVTYISPDRTLAARLDYTASAVNASAVWKAKLNGTGVGLAVIDSGIRNDDPRVLGVLPRVVYAKDFVAATAVANSATAPMWRALPTPTASVRNAPVAREPWWAWRRTLHLSAKRSA